MLRAAAALIEAKVPTTRILRSLRRLRTQLPSRVPVSGLRVEAVGDTVVVREGDALVEAVRNAARPSPPIM